MNMQSYIQWLTKQIFKMLPMSDTSEIVEKSHLKDFIQSITIQVDGSFSTFEPLKDNPKYLAVANVLHYWNSREIDIPLFKREIRSIMSLLNQIESDGVGNFE